MSWFISPLKPIGTLTKYGLFLSSGLDIVTLLTPTDVEFDEVEVDTALFVGLLLKTHVDIYPDYPAHTAQYHHHNHKLKQLKVPLPLHGAATQQSSCSNFGIPIMVVFFRGRDLKNLEN